MRDDAPREFANDFIERSNAVHHQFVCCDLRPEGATLIYVAAHPHDIYAPITRHGVRETVMSSLTRGGRQRRKGTAFRLVTARTDEQGLHAFVFQRCRVILMRGEHANRPELAARCDVERGGRACNPIRR